MHKSLKTLTEETSAEIWEKLTLEYLTSERVKFRSRPYDMLNYSLFHILAESLR